VARHTAAVAAANALAEEKDASRETLYGTACVLSLCSGAAEGPADLREGYGARAVELLRRAIARGPISADHLLREPDFLPLRRRGDFQDLVKELQAKGEGGLPEKP